MSDRTNPWLVPGRPNAAEQGEALVTGFHAAFFGAALFFVAGIFVMTVLLKRDDVAAVDTDRPMTEMAA